MKLSKGKQSKSGKKRKEEKGNDGKKRRIRGEWNSLTVSPSSSPPNLFSHSFYFFPQFQHNMERVWVCGCKCALTQMGCLRTRGILGDISYSVVTQIEEWKVTTSTLVKVQTPATHLQIYPPVCQLTPAHSGIRGLQQEFHPEAGALSVKHHIQPDLNLPQNTSSWGWQECSAAFTPLFKSLSL